jgi:hypothetical protein
VSAFLADRELVELLADDPELLALADAVAATQRRSRARGRMLLVAAAAALVVATTASLALGRSPLDLFHGSPPNVAAEEHFAVWNHLTQQAAQAGAELPAVDEASVHGILSVQTDEGRLYLWAPAAGADGAACWLIQIGDDPAAPSARYGPSYCVAPRAAEPIWWTQSPNTALPSLSLVSGRVSVDATSIDVRLDNGHVLRASVVEGLFLTAAPVGATVWSVTAYDAGGDEIARSTHGHRITAAQLEHLDLRRGKLRP